MLDLWVVLPRLWWIGALVEFTTFPTYLGALLPIEDPGLVFDPLKLPVFANELVGLTLTFPEALTGLFLIELPDLYRLVYS